MFRQPQTAIPAKAGYPVRRGLSTSLRAKRSNPSRRLLRHGLLRRIRSLAMTLIQFRVLATHGVRGLHELVPPEREQGMPGACCTRGLVCNGVDRCAHEHTGTAGALRHPLRNGLTAYAALSLETNSSCLHRCRLDGSIDPVGSKSPPAA